jgi:hypothetical protein
MDRQRFGPTEQTASLKEGRYPSDMVDMPVGQKQGIEVGKYRAPVTEKMHTRFTGINKQVLSIKA